MRPNIVFIMTDQQRWDTLGCLGFDHVITPNLDSLAQRGVAFSKTFVQGAVCAPSRASVVCCKYVHTHGVLNNSMWLLDSEPNWIERLRASGYHTANIGKMHAWPIRHPCGFEYRLVVENKNYVQGQMGPPDDYDLFLQERGMVRPANEYPKTVKDWWDQLQAVVWPYEEELYPDNFVGQRAVNYLQDYDFARPLFLWVGFVGPHDPYDVPASALERYRGVRIPDPAVRPGEADHNPPEHRDSMRRMDGMRTQAAIWWSRATPERIRRMRLHYFANITVIDDWVGRIVETLDALGQLENTTFIFTSDHGDCLGDHDMVYKFNTHYDSVARVPLVISGYGVSARGMWDALVELRDIGPTVLELAGVEDTRELESQSLRPFLEGRDVVLHDAVFSEHRHRIMVRTQHRKLVFYAGRPYGELYDLQKDPQELHNLWNVPEARAERSELMERLLHWYGSTAFTTPVKAP